jgi:hypothetical protein
MLRKHFFINIFNIKKQFTMFFNNFNKNGAKMFLLIYFNIKKYFATFFVILIKNIAKNVFNK